MAQALPCEQTDLNLRLIEPTPVCGCVVDRESVPDLGTKLRAEQIGQGLAAVDIQIVHH